VTDLRRGFRADAERLAIELRAELGLSAADRLAPRALAEFYGISVLGLADLELEFRHVEVVASAESAAWSALTVFDGTRRLIVLNDVHGPPRLANSLAHELAHVFLEHEPVSIKNLDGSRTWNATMEAEADELGAQLLLPNKVARRLAVAGWSVERIAERYGVSLELARWRVGVSGGNIARHRVERKRFTAVRRG
jgi:Zn-dependent peptidase ImmA (M78 family)